MNLWWVNRERNKKRKETNKFHVNRERNQKFYQSAKWLRTRLHKLYLNPLCENCIKNNIIEPAVEIHHTININTNQGWLNRYNIDLLQSLCKSCHSIESKKEQQQEKFNQIEKNMDDLNSFD